MSLHYLVKYKMCKIENPLVFGDEQNKSLELIFCPILNVKLCFVLDRLSV